MLTRQEWQETTHRCHECGSDMEETTGTLTFKMEEYTITLGNVPMKLCPDCGERYVPGPVAEMASEIAADARDMILREEAREREHHRHTNVSIRDVSVQFNTVVGDRPLAFA